MALNGGISFGEIIGSLTKKRIHNTIQAVFLIGSILLAGTLSLVVVDCSS
jgi:hypothetical protein